MMKKEPMLHCAYRIDLMRFFQMNSTSKNNRWTQLKFFLRHWGKTPFMLAMSKRLQTIGIEGLYAKGKKAFWAFFIFYLIRDSILYIIIPVYLAKYASSGD
jgi:hypothetical protein